MRTLQECAKYASTQMVHNNMHRPQVMTWFVILFDWLLTVTKYHGVEFVATIGSLA